MKKFLRLLIPGVGAIAVIGFLQLAGAPSAVVMVGSLGTFVALYLFINLKRRR